MCVGSLTCCVKSSDSIRFLNLFVYVLFWLSQWKLKSPRMIQWPGWVARFSRRGSNSVKNKFSFVPPCFDLGGRYTIDIFTLEEPEFKFISMYSKEVKDWLGDAVTDRDELHITARPPPLCPVQWEVKSLKPGGVKLPIQILSVSLDDNQVSVSTAMSILLSIIWSIIQSTLFLTDWQFRRHRCRLSFLFLKNDFLPALKALCEIHAILRDFKVAYIVGGSLSCYLVICDFIFRSSLGS